MVGDIFGVSRQRVHQLVAEGVFSHWTFYTMKWLSQEEVVALGKLHRRAGENQHGPSAKQMWKASLEVGSELLRLHAAGKQNRKEQALPLHREVDKALQQQKPANFKADDLVLVNGVPKMKEFRQDLEKASIPFLDGRGHRMDYHALRTTFITRLSTMKVHPRLAMKLARHSDMRLTMKTYTDAGQLPLREVMDTLPGFGERAGSRIDFRNLGPTGQTVSRPVTETRELKTVNSLEKTGENHHNSPLVTMSPEKSEWRRGGDSNPRYGLTRIPV